MKWEAYVLHNLYKGARPDLNAPASAHLSRAAIGSVSTLQASGAKYGVPDFSGRRELSS